MPALIKKHDRIGLKFIMESGEKLEIIDYINCTNVLVKFEDGTIKQTFFTQIIKGNVINPNTIKISNNLNKNTFGVGYLGIGEYTYNHKSFICWKGIFERCYNTNNKEKLNTYIDCTVDERWHNFQVFAEWYENNYIDGFHLDKDILFKGNKVYSPETCCFVPIEINSLFTKTNKLRGEYPIGVSLNKKLNKFISTIHIFGKNKHLGVFNDIDSAFNNYKYYKEQYIKSIADKWKHLINENVYLAMYNYIVEITD